jgi:hypothetical protein
MAANVVARAAGRSAIRITLVGHGDASFKKAASSRPTDPPVIRSFAQKQPMQIWKVIKEDAVD